MTQITEDNTLKVIRNGGDMVNAIGFLPVGTKNNFNKFGLAEISLLVDPAVTVNLS